MQKNNLTIPFPKPEQLSDPHGDWELLEDKLDLIIKKPEAELDWQDFHCLFQVGLPAGTYEESAYFLPHAFDYLASGKDDSFEFMSDLFWFISENLSKIEADGFKADIQRALRDLLNLWISNFTVEHFDEAACIAKGWRVKFFNRLIDIEYVAGWIDDLVRFKSLEQWAYEQISPWCFTPKRFEDSAWFLALSKQQRSGLLIAPGRFWDLFQDDERILEHYERVMNNPKMKSVAQSYWESLLED